MAIYIYIYIDFSNRNNLNLAHNFKHQAESRATYESDRGTGATESRQKKEIDKLKSYKCVGTISPGVELKSPATMTSGMHSYLSDTRVLNCDKRDRRYLACASLTSANSGSLGQKYKCQL